MVFLTRRCEFSAAHRYYLPDLADEANRDLYGECAHVHGHGHDYTLYVTICGETDSRTGLVVNISLLKPLLQDCVVDALDREFLSIQHPFCRGRVPTCENLAALLWEVLSSAFEAEEIA